MSFWNRISRAFRRAPPPPRLRNRPDGLAWIKGCTEQAEVMNGRVVKTVRQDGGFWTLDPVQCYVIRPPMDIGGVHFPGLMAEVVALHDDLLEPIREVGDGEKDESLAYLPKVPSGKVPEIAP